MNFQRNLVVLTTMSALVLVSCSDGQVVLPETTLPLSSMTITVPDQPIVNADPPAPVAGGRSLPDFEDYDEEPIEEVDCEDAENLCESGAVDCDEIADYCDYGPDGIDLPDEFDWDE
jgi:hypothetical protein